VSPVQVQRATVTVSGKSYELSGLDSEEHYRHVAEVTDRRIAETARQNPRLDREGAAVAAALSLADELVKSRHTLSRLRRQLEETRGADEAGA